MEQVTVVGAGLAGCEATWQLVKRNIPVRLIEMRPKKESPAFHTDQFAELVCSNSLRSNAMNNAVGILKEELRQMDSLIMKSADMHAVPAGSALAVDRETFSQYITDTIKNHPLVDVVNEEMTALPEGPCIIATGPLTSDSLAKAIHDFTSEDTFHFYDAAAPIIEKDSIDFSKAYYKSRYDKGEASYINCPMNADEFEAFYDALIHAECVNLHDFEKETYFEGCMPIEEMARRGKKTMLFGPLKPVGLEKDKDSHPVAVVQLRQDNVAASMYNIVGFQTHLTWPEQRRVFALIPGLENLKITRYGVMHRNSYLSSPIVLKETYQSKKRDDLFFAGQLTGVEGYVESCASGLIAGINAAMEIKGRDPLILDRSEAYIGVLIDDLVTKKNREPYRMMTSRAEYRLLLRQDNADLRLTKKGYEIGLISQERYDWVCKKEELIKKEIERVNEVKLGANARVQHVLEQYGSIPLHTGTTLSDLIRRPELDYDKLAEIDTDRPDLPAEVTEQVNILIKYDGYISRQIKQVEKFKKLEKKKLPEKFDYNEISGLRIEAQQKLNEFQPLNIGQASRISGVTPADISVLLVYLEQLKYSNPDLFFKLNPDEQKEKQE